MSVTIWPRLRIALCAVGAFFCLNCAAFADVTTDLIKSLQLVAAPAPVKQRSDWRVPRKVMLLGAKAAVDRRLALGAHIDLARGILADQNHREARLDAARQ